MKKRGNLDYKSSDIQTLSGLDHIRKHAGMYGFFVHQTQAHVQCIKELLDNSCDEVRVLSHKEHVIKVFMLKRKGSYQIVIRDQGRGVPLDKLVDSFTVMNTSGKSSRSYIASTGTYGIGAKATAALSRSFSAVSRRAEGMACVTVIEGSVANEKVVIGGKYDPMTYGTTVIYEPDSNLLQHCDSFFDENKNDAMQKIWDLLEFLSAFIPNMAVEVFLGNKSITDNVLLKSPQAIWEACDDIQAKLVKSFEVGMSPKEFMMKTNNITSA